MESTAAQLRWILIIVGIVIVAAIYFYTRVTEKRRRSKQSEYTRTPPTIESATENDSGVLDLSPALETAEKPEPEVEEPPLMVLHIQADKNIPFSGKEIADAAQRLNMVHGGISREAGFFEYRVTLNQQLPCVIYVVNMLNPGTFQWNAMNHFHTPGLSLFAKIPPGVPPLDVFRALWDCAGELADALGGVVLDEQRQALTPVRRLSVEQQLKSGYLRQSQRNQES